MRFTSTQRVGLGVAVTFRGDKDDITREIRKGGIGGSPLLGAHGGMAKLHHEAEGIEMTDLGLANFPIWSFWARVTSWRRIPNPRYW